MTAPTPTDPATPPASTDPAAPPAEPTGQTPPAQPPAAPSGDESPWADPDKAKAEIERLRRENASARTVAKDNAAKAAREALAQEIGKTLGLVQDDAQVDPNKLVSDLGAAQTAVKAARIENAVLRAAMGPESNADPVALMDSVTFREKVSALDPSDTAAITAAITEAVTANPRLGRTQTPGRMQPNRAQGSSAQPPLTTAQRIAQAEREGDKRTVARLKASQVLNSQQ